MEVTRPWGPKPGRRHARLPAVKFLEMDRRQRSDPTRAFKGKGYPPDSSAADPPLRPIVALAKSTTPFTSKRVLQAAIAHEISRAMIIKESGRHLTQNVRRSTSSRRGQFAVTANVIWSAGVAA